MLGSGKSSLAIWTAFDTASTATVRLLKWLVKVAWRRAEVSAAAFATVGTSLVQGTDMVQGVSSVISKPDMFQFYDESARAVKLEYEREVLEPLGGIALGQADIALENTDGRFTPNAGLTCGTALYPNRPMAINVGFDLLNEGVVQTVSVFKGLTDQPHEDKISRQMTVHAYDYLKYLNQYELETTVFVNKRSDEIISSVLTTLGFSTDQFIVDTGLNTIGFAWFTKGTKAGDAIRQICEAEEAFFYQDEEGIIHFENRRKYKVAPYNAVAWVFNADDIIDWKEDDNTQIINRVIVTANPRTVQGSMEVWRDSAVETIEANSSKDVWANFDNPCSVISAPVATTDYLANTAADGSGTNVTAQVTVTRTAFGDTCLLTIQNNYNAKVYITFLRLMGTPAVVTQSIEQYYEDNDSIGKYERQQLEVNNDFIDNEGFAYYLARALVRKYKDPRRRIMIKVRGVPQLQLRDNISVYDRDTATYTNYRLMKIAGVLQGGAFYQTLTLREVTQDEADAWAIVGQDTVEGVGVVGF